MKTDNGVTLVEPGDSLPQLQGAKELYCDFETRSNSYFEPGFYPYHGSSIAGIAITADDIDESWYVPIRHRYKEGTRNPNLDVESTIQWLKNVIESCESWVNHNIKFDAHFALVEGIEPKCRLVDTLTLAKIIESDRLGYDLSVLSFEWLDENIEKYEFRIKNYLANLNLGQGNRKVKDYSLIPVDYMAPYAGQDVLTNRRLWKYIQSKCPEQCERVLETEIKLTSALLDIERIGLNVNLQQLELTKLKLLNSLIKKEDKLAELTGVEFSPHTNGGCFKVLCSKYGLPILGWTDNENPSPSFDKHTLLQYSKHPKVSADPKLSKIVSLILKYRKQHTLLTLFVEKYIELQTDGVLRPSYNQCVRTGRMSCKNPNGQQLNKEAKSLILPGKGRAFLSIDYNQVEFRLIAHYIQDSAVIEAYKQNPYQDFHTWVAEMCDTTRGPAKNINFAIAFGGGKKRVVEMLSNNAELMAGFGEKIERIKREKNLTEDQVVSLYEDMCRRRGLEVYETYHKTLPSLKYHTKKAAFKIKEVGYVRNGFGRRRHLPEKAAFRAFNAVVQSTAADVLKQKCVELSPVYNERIRRGDVQLVGLVHDEFLFNVPEEKIYDVDLLLYIFSIIESPSISLRVPLKASGTVSTKSWADCGNSGKVTSKSLEEEGVPW